MTPPWWCHLRAGQGRSLECEPAHGLQVYRVRSPPPTQPSLTQMVFMYMVSAPSHRHRSNHLLAGLSIDIQTRWASHMEVIDMPLGQVLCEAGGIIEYVYFPTTAVVSLLYVMSDGGSAEIAIIGNDGLVGVSVLMGGGSTTSRALVQNEGQGFRVKADWVQLEFESSKPVRHLFLKFMQALITQMTQTAACNKHHTLDQQLCRWLLLTLDRHEGNELRMTKQMIANMLGVSQTQMRAGAMQLQSEGLLVYNKGIILVKDRIGIAQHSCECYSVVKREYQRLLPQQVAEQT